MELRQPSVRWADEVEEEKTSGGGFMRAKSTMTDYQRLHLTPLDKWRMGRLPYKLVLHVVVLLLLSARVRAAWRAARAAAADGTRGGRCWW